MSLFETSKTPDPLVLAATHDHNMSQLDNLAVRTNIPQRMWIEDDMVRLRMGVVDWSSEDFGHVGYADTEATTILKHLFETETDAQKLYVQEFSDGEDTFYRFPWAAGDTNVDVWALLGWYGDVTHGLNNLQRRQYAIATFAGSKALELSTEEQARMTNSINEDISLSEARRMINMQAYAHLYLNPGRDPSHFAHM